MAMRTRILKKFSAFRPKAIIESGKKIASDPITDSTLYDKNYSETPLAIIHESGAWVLDSKGKMRRVKDFLKAHKEGSPENLFMIAIAKGRVADLTTSRRKLEEIAPDVLSPYGISDKQISKVVKKLKRNKKRS